MWVLKMVLALTQVIQTYLGVPAPDMSNTSLFGSPFPGIMRAKPKSKIFTTKDWNNRGAKLLMDVYDMKKDTLGVAYNHLAHQIQCWPALSPGK